MFCGLSCYHSFTGESMWKLTLYITIATAVGIFIGMLFSKVLTLPQIKEGTVSFFQGLIRRFDESVKGNDGHYSSARIMEYMWAIGTLSLLCVCVLRGINIQEGILYLLGAALGFGNIKGAVNKAQEVKDSINKKDEANG